MKKPQEFKYLSYPQAILVVGTYDREGRPNIAPVALGGMCSHRPPLLFVSLRAATLTHRNIVERQAFTVNVPSSEYIVETDYAGQVSGRDHDKFADCGLTPLRSERVDAPLILEFPTAAECRLAQTVDVGSHTMFIGEIVHLQGDAAISTADLSYLRKDLTDLPDMVQAGGFVYAVTAEGRCYVGLGEVLGRAYRLGRELRDKS
jgi:flavin reductase (DIM6/NTAB) family NADH-FMN oxidoreductase RutF